MIFSAPILAPASDLVTGRTNMFGTPGNLIDMPTAEMAPEGQLTTTISAYGSGSDFTTRTTLSFQVLPRLSASFRYSAVSGILPATGSPNFTTLHDRSFDINYRKRYWQLRVSITRLSCSINGIHIRDI